MRYLWLGVLLVGCGQDRMMRRGFTGDWTLRLTCDAAVDAVPGCGGEMASLVQIWRPDDPDASLADGEHRTLLPGYVDPDGSYVGVSGPVVAGGRRSTPGDASNLPHRAPRTWGELARSIVERPE